MGFKEMLIQNVVTFTLLLGIVLGVTIGTIISVIHPEKYDKRVLMYWGFPGEIFMRMVRAIAIPLIASCIVYAVGSVYRHLLKRLGFQLMIFIIVTKFQSAILAACFGMLFRAGQFIETKAGDKEKEVTEHLITITDTMLDLLRNMCPVNLLEVTLRYYKTRLVNSNNDTLEDIDKWEVLDGDVVIDYTNILGLVSVSVISGITLNLIDEEGQYMLSLFKCAVRATMTITMWVMRLAPIGITFILAREILQMENAINVLTQMSTFIAVLFTVLAIQMIVYSLTYFVFVRKNPLIFFWDLSESVMIALATAKSPAALPYSIFCLREKIHMDSRVVDFVIPIGTSLNKDGTNVWLVLGAIFLTDVNNKPLYLGDVCAIIVYSVIASFATTGVPQSSLRLLEVLLLSRGIPSTGMHLLIAIDWICARFRAMINVYGDAVAVGVLNQINRRVLEEFPEIDVQYIDNY